MIHSLAGGTIKENKEVCFCLVFVESLDAKLWYRCEKNEVNENDSVIVPYGQTDRLVEGKVIKVQSCLNQIYPVPLNRAKKVFKVNK